MSSAREQFRETRIEQLIELKNGGNECGNILQLRPQTSIQIEWRQQLSFTTQTTVSDTNYNDKTVLSAFTDDEWFQHDLESQRLVSRLQLYAKQSKDSALV